MPIFFLYNDKFDVGTVTVKDYADGNHPKVIFPGGLAVNDPSFALPPGTQSQTLFATSLVDGTGVAGWIATNAVNQVPITVEEGVVYNLSDGTARPNE